MPELQDNASVREQARKEQERRDTVNELGALSKCLAGYLGCFDDTKTHATPDSELVKLLEAGCKSALKRLAPTDTNPSLRLETMAFLAAKLEDIEEEEEKDDSFDDPEVMELFDDFERRHFALRHEITVVGKNLAIREQWSRLALAMLHHAAVNIRVYETAVKQADLLRPKPAKKMGKK